jgi:hypothetical protein
MMKYHWHFERGDAVHFPTILKRNRAHCHPVG